MSIGLRSGLPLLACLGTALIAAPSLHADETAPPPAEKASDTPAAKPVEKSAEELAREAAKKEVEGMQLELQKLTTEYQLMQQRQKNELVKAELERQEIASRAALEQAKLEQELASMRSEVARVQAELQLEKTRQDKTNASVESTLSQKALEARVAASELESDLAKLRLESQKLQTENAVRQEQVKAAQMDAALVKQSIEAEIMGLRNKLEIRTAQDQAAAKVADPVARRAAPLEGETLWVSDRRISLNGPISAGTADYVSDRIDFFNNASKSDPIFIVIDSSPGGSVMEGYRIVNAISTSPAPVHVVVKSFAASMAAVITTLAPHSYCLPNAIILHHQMSSGMSGNLTQQSESLKMGMEWAKRLADPVAKKMGISYDEFVKKMYENNSNGDWEAFADKARELKWVDHVVAEIRESGFRDQPTGARTSLPFWMQDMQVDEKGNRYVTLPPLMPFDYWFIYDPNDFFR